MKMETNNVKLTDDEVVKAFKCCYMGEACESCSAKQYCDWCKDHQDEKGGGEK